MDAYNNVGIDSIETAKKCILVTVHSAVNCNKNRRIADEVRVRV